MIFPSHIFLLLFLPVFLIGWYSLKNKSSRLAYLTLMSYLFYGWWDYRFLSLMVVSTVLDYFCGLSIHKSGNQARRKQWLALSVVGNLGILGVFKYYDFFVGSMSDLLSIFVMDVSFTTLDIILPLGISFYTFQSMSYTIDIYNNKAKPAENFVGFSAYVSMFPQLVAGPIVRYSFIAEQLRTVANKVNSYINIKDGIWLFTFGLIKKIWIADSFAPLAENLFDSNESPQFWLAWGGALAYTFQLYFDFSAYSDMARGLGKMMGFDFPINFNSPYKSKSISEFWNRWHITLSHWLRDYLFIPMGGSRNGVVKTIRNLSITMFLGGLWHGAAWNYVLWGMYHGLLLAINALFKQYVKIRIYPVVGVLVTFLLVVLGWVLFRAPELSKAGEIYVGMVGMNGFEPMHESKFISFLKFPLPGEIRLREVVLFVLCSAWVFFLPNSEEIKKRSHFSWGIVIAIVFLVTLTQLMKDTPFLYFQF